MKNYEELKKWVRDTINRDEIFDNLLPIWIARAEDYLDKRLRHPALSSNFVAEVRAGFNAIRLPTNYLELQYVIAGKPGPKSAAGRPTLHQGAKMLYRSSIEYFQEAKKETGEPGMFTTEGAELIIDGDRTKSRVIRVNYFATPPRLSDQIPENLYLLIAGDFLYCYAVAEGFEYDGQLDKALIWRQKANDAYSVLQYQADKERDSGSTVVSFADSNVADYF